MDRNEIQTGDILLVHGRWALARAIQFVTRSKWNHAGIFCWVWDELFVVEAEKEGLQFTKWSDPKYANGKPLDRKLKIRKPVTAFPDHKALSVFMAKFIGKTRYDFASLIYHVHMARKGEWKGKTGVKASNRFTCSEWVAFVYNVYRDFFPEWWKAAPREINDMHQGQFIDIDL
jgi:hypothetical protein